ncbi:hypothetical protein [Ureibacillus sp. GCM10028918]|uniref:hypothetical protein n=1 Tax=Ureibacillus sp. GCM10028918 TaxID=3273429 RepID=UPI0036F43E97
MISSQENEKYIEKGNQTVQLTTDALHKIYTAVSETVAEISTISQLLSNERQNLMRLFMVYKNWLIQSMELKAR